MSKSSLHTSVRDWYSRPGDRFEAKINDYVIDILRDDLLIEIQTRNFSSIKKKLMNLVQKYNVRLVYPIPERKWIVQISKSKDEVISRRKSPKKGTLIDLFEELVRIPDLINEDTFTMEVLLIVEEEIRCNDGRGSWRRKGVSIINRKLIDVVDTVRFNNREDFLRFLPTDLHQPFTNKRLAKNMGISIRQSQKMTYCLKKMGALKVVGKKRNEQLFKR